MSQSIPFPLAALAVIALSRICTATDLLDAPGPGYFQQVQRLAPERQPVVRPNVQLAPTIQIHSTTSYSTDLFREAEKPLLSELIPPFQQVPTLIKTGQGELRVAPKSAKPQ